MSEHEPIDPESYKTLVAVTRQLEIEERIRVSHHLMYGPDHDSDGYHVLYGGVKGAPELKERFKLAILSHEAAILREEITAQELWSEPEEYL